MLHFRISGMTDQVRADLVKSAIKKVEPTASVKVDPTQGEVTVHGAVDPALVNGAIRNAGFDVEYRSS